MVGVTLTPLDNYEFDECVLNIMDDIEICDTLTPCKVLKIFEDNGVKVAISNRHSITNFIEIINNF